MNTPFLREQGGDVGVAVKVQPRAARNAIRGTVGDELKIQVTAPPVDSAANEAVIRLLSEVLGRPRNAFQIVRGQTARRKVIRVRGLPVAEAASRLRAAMQNGPD